MRIRTLERSDRRAGFDCGDSSLNLFIERYAWQNQSRHHLGVTYVAVDDRTRRVVGYFTLAAASLMREDVPESRRNLPYAEIPAIRIVRLAVDQRVQGIGLGSELLRAALSLTLGQSLRIGCAGVLVDANPGCEGFYERFGFLPCRITRGSSAARPRPTPMYLEIGSIEAALE